MDKVINIAITISGGKVSVEGQDEQMPTQMDEFMNVDRALKDATMGMGQIVNGKYFAPTTAGVKAAQKEAWRKKLRYGYPAKVINLAQKRNA
jgi:hypothetical protein